MIRRLLVVVPALALLGACVGDDDSYRGRRYDGGIYQPRYSDGDRRDYDRDRRREYDRDRRREDDRRRRGYYRSGQDPNAINDYNRPGP